MGRRRITISVVSIAAFLVGASPLAPALGGRTSAATAGTAPYGILPVTVPSLPLPTLPLPLPTVTLPALPLPTATLPALPLPTATLPPLPLPTSTVHVLPLPTVTVPALPLPLPTSTVHVLPLPTVTLGALPRPTATQQAQQALSQPTATAPSGAPQANTPVSRGVPAPTLTTAAGPSGSAGTRPTATPTALPRSGSGSVPPPGRAAPTPSGPSPAPGARSSTAPPVNAAVPPTITLSPRVARPGARVAIAGSGFGAGQFITVSLDGEAMTTLPSVVISSLRGRFSATFIAPAAILPGRNTIAAAASPGGRSAVAPLIGERGVASQFYFAGGENTGDVHAFLTLLNSDARTAHVRLTFYSRSGAVQTRTATVDATRERTMSVSDLFFRPGSFGLAVRADHAIAATLSLSRKGRDGDMLLGSPALATHWYLAEGYTSLTFRETVAVLNPAGKAARVTLRLLPKGGRHARSVTLRVAPHSEAIADVNRLMPRQALSVAAASDRPVVVARTLTFSSDSAGRGFGLTLRTGSVTPATTWLFAEGSTVDRFQTFLTVLNPNRSRARVSAQFYDSSGHTLGHRTLVVAAHSRSTLKLNTFLKASGIASVVLSDRPVAVERVEYFGSPNNPRIAGSDVFGRNGPATRWSFAGGYGASANEFLLLYNPSVVTVPVEATFYGRSGQTRRYRFTVAPHVRLTISVRRVTSLFAGEHGVMLQSTNGRGFVAEQTIFTSDHRTLLSTQGFAQ